MSWPWLVAAAAWHPLALRRAMATLSPDDVAVQRLFPQLDTRHQEIVELCLRLELERDMGGWARFVAEDSGALLRVGCLLKLSKKGFFTFFFHFSFILVFCFLKIFINFFRD